MVMTKPESQNLSFSVVVPVMNEEENVRILYDRISEVMRGMAEPYEVVFVDDGSTDNTFGIMESIYKEDKNFKVVKFRRNYGQSAAMAAGFEYASGSIVISMDGDLQNDPIDIPKMIEKLREGYDIVAGWRKNRKDKLFIRKVPSKIANKIIRKLTGVELHDTGCSLKVYRSEVIKKIRLYGELHRFIPALARVEGARITELAVNHHARQFGVSKYNLTRTFRVIMDLTTLNLFIKYLMKPMHFFGMLGFLFNTLGLTALFWSLFLLFDGGDTSIVNVPISVTFLLIASGCQFVFYGLLASIVVRTGDKKNNPLREFFQLTQ